MCIRDREYPEVQFDDWYIDIMTAKLLDDKRRRDFKVVVTGRDTGATAQEFTDYVLDTIAKL